MSSKTMISYFLLIVPIGIMLWAIAAWIVLSIYEEYIKKKS